MNQSQFARTILLVEDNEDDVFLLRRGLKQAHLEPILQVVTDGQQAMDYLARRNQGSDGASKELPACVLLDLQLPYFTGFQILEWMRRQPRLARLPVIILTSSTNLADIERAYAAGANSYLVKPSSIDQQARMAQAICLFWLEFNQSPLLVGAG